MLQVEDFRDVTHLLHELVVSKLLIDPLISGMPNRNFREDAQTVIREAREAIIRKYYSETHSRNVFQAEVFGGAPLDDAYVHACIDDFIVGTAVFLSHDFYGEVNVDLDIAQMATHDVGAFLEKHGLADLCWCYGTIMGYENHNAIQYYGRMSVTDFTTGVKHRPWAPYSLQNDIEMGIALGLYHVDHDLDFIELTEAGQQRLQEERRMLEESGYLEHRMKAMFLSQFDHLQEDYEQILAEMVPNADEVRRSFIDFAGISEGMEVLELGCGTGALTFDAGLIDKVGQTGMVVGIDPSLGMLHQAEKKKDQLGLTNVILDGGRAEDTSYGDNEFDAVLGVAFFHFTDQQRTMEEMIRVARPGSTIALSHPLNIHFYPDFYREWFSVFIEMTAQSGSSAPGNYLPESGDLKRLFERYDLEQVIEVPRPIMAIYCNPVGVVNYFVRGVGLFQRQLLPLPWAARNQLIQQLIEKGKEIVKRYSVEELTIPFPNVFVKGKVAKK